MLGYLLSSAHGPSHVRVQSFRGIGNSHANVDMSVYRTTRSGLTRSSLSIGRRLFQISQTHRDSTVA